MVSQCPPPTTTSIKFANFYLSNFFATSQAWKSINFQQNFSQPSKEKRQQRHRKNHWEPETWSAARQTVGGGKTESEKRKFSFPAGNGFSPIKTSINQLKAILLKILIGYECSFFGLNKFALEKRRVPASQIGDFCIFFWLLWHLRICLPLNIRKI